VADTDITVYFSGDGSKILTYDGFTGGKYRWSKYTENDIIDVSVNPYTNWIAIGYNEASPPKGLFSGAIQEIWSENPIDNDWSPPAYPDSIEGTATITWGTHPTTSTVPNIVGMTQEEGENAIEEAILVSGEITEEYNETVAIGIIISQNPVAGTEVALGSSVNFVVSLGPEPPTKATNPTPSNAKKNISRYLNTLEWDVD